ncbi:AMP-binding protein [Kytococcus sedentarius]|uniref:AMP-binding protein n=1 Tax=Kytococcus sedentarius TaxID=1276 RepID=UPI00384ACBFD
MSTPTAEFHAARDAVLALHDADDAAVDAFVMPRPTEFNWGLHHIDAVAAGPRADTPALRIVDVVKDGTRTHQLTWAEVSATSSQMANHLRDNGVARGDRVLVMLGNQTELWQVMVGSIKLGAEVIPATTLLTPEDLTDRVARGKVKHVITNAYEARTFARVDGEFQRFAVCGDDETPEGWLRLEDFASAPTEFTPEAPTRADDTMLLYFTSGTTSEPKLVEHTHTSYTYGALSTMFWVGLRPGDVHVNISSPGWAKHAWSSLFTPWTAEATILVVNQPRFDAATLLQVLADEGATTFCAPPTVYRMLIQQDLAAWRDRLAIREMVGAGEPLNPEVIRAVEKGLGITIRDGFGQTETTAQIGNPPGRPVKPGSMGRPLPGYDVVLLDAATGTEVTEPGEEGELCLRLEGAGGRPLGLMVGYHGDADRTAASMRDGAYHTGDVAMRDADGYITYVGRADDVFKASDYRISPFEVESVLIEHELVAEAAVVPSPDPTRLAVPKAYVVLVEGTEPSREIAESILSYCRANLAPYKRVRRLEFGELPKTVSGKIRRVELKARENEFHPVGDDPTERASEWEFWESDFPDLKG